MSANPESMKAQVALMLAVDKFNAAFGYQMCLPIDAGSFGSMIDIAEMRGRQDIADELRAADQTVAAVAA